MNHTSTSVYFGQWKVLWLFTLQSCIHGPKLRPVWHRYKQKLSNCFWYFVIVAISVFSARLSPENILDWCTWNKFRKLRYIPSTWCTVVSFKRSRYDFFAPKNFLPRVWYWDNTAYFSSAASWPPKRDKTVNNDYIYVFELFFSATARLLSSFSGSSNTALLE